MWAKSFFSLAILTAALAQSVSTTYSATTTLTPPIISWLSPTRYQTVDFTKGLFYVVFTPNSEIQFEEIALYQDCDTTRGTLVLTLGGVNVSSGVFTVTIRSTLSSTTLYCIEMSDVNFWFNSPAFYAITPQSATNVTSAIVETAASTIPSSSYPSASAISGGSGSTSSSSSGISTGAIAGIAVGAAAVLGVAFLAGFFLRRKNTQPPPPEPYIQPRPESFYPVYPPPGPGGPPGWVDPNYANPYGYAPQYIPQGGQGGQPLTPGELEKLYSTQPIITAGQVPVNPPEIASPHGNVASPPPPFHTVLKPYDPEPIQSTSTNVLEAQKPGS